jgi:hypothetical protein
VSTEEELAHEAYAIYRGESHATPSVAHLGILIKLLGSTSDMGLLEPVRSAAKTARFGEFWDAYPARNGKKLGKKLAKMKFHKLSESDQAKAITAARYYAASRYGRAGFARDAERFLAHEWWRAWLDPETAMAAPPPAPPTERDKKGRLLDPHGLSAWIKLYGDPVQWGYAP